MTTSEAQADDDWIGAIHRAAARPPEHLREALSFAQMSRLAEFWEDRATDEDVAPDLEALLTGQAEGMWELAQDVSSDWQPPEPACIPFMTVFVRWLERNDDRDGGGDLLEILKTCSGMPAELQGLAPARLYLLADYWADRSCAPGLPVERAAEFMGRALGLHDLSLVSSALNLTPHSSPWLNRSVALLHLVKTQQGIPPADMDGLRAIYENAAILQGSEYENSLSYGQMILLASYFAQRGDCDPELSLETSALLLGRSEGLFRLAERLGNVWAPSGPVNEENALVKKARALESG